MMELRDYQKEMLGRLREAWGAGKRSVMLQMPTGTGKTVLLASLINELASKNVKCEMNNEQCGDGTCAGGVLIVAHRRELIEQIQATLNLFGIENEAFSKCQASKVERSKYGAIQVERNGENGVGRETLEASSLSNRGYAQRTHGDSVNVSAGTLTACPVYVESIQMLTARMGNSQFSIFNFQFSLIIIDEAHHALAKTYQALWERWPQARILGLTATPCRLNGAAFTDLFDVLLQSQDIQRFIEQGWLSDFEYVSVQPDSEEMQKVRGLKKRGADGDYQTRELATVMDVPESIEHLYSSYHTYARGKKGIVYAINVEHARHIAEYYASRGVRCAVIDAGTASSVRLQLVQAYRGNDLDVLINVDIFSEGFDCPEVEFIQLARPTLSLAKYLQQVGRGMRVSKGKPYVTILDNVGLYQTFGLPTDNRDWQGMFLGRLAGKGDASGSGRPLIIRDEVADKQLINLDMLHIKRFNEQRTRLEVFLLGGRFGIMLMGQVTCAAQFRRVQRLHHPRYFALAVYDGTREEYTTVIDNEGRNMKLAFRGRVSVDEDIFINEDPHGHCMYYDAIGKQVYTRFPRFMSVAGLEVQERTDAYCLRDWENKPTSYLSKDDTHYNESIVISNGVLINKQEGNRQSRIRGYLGDSVLVLPEKGIGLQQVYMDGRRGSLFPQLPREATAVPDWKRMGLVPLATMSRESVEEKERSMIRMRYEEFVESLVEHNDAYLDEYLGLGFQVHHAGYTEGKNRFISHSHVLFKVIRTLSLDMQLDGNAAMLAGRQEITYRRRDQPQQTEVYDYRIKMKKREGVWLICGIRYEKVES